LADKGIEFEAIEVRDTPPSIDDLKLALSHVGEVKKLFNSSGVDYRALGMKDKLPTLSEAQALQVLSENGNLVKRPLVISSAFSIVGFKEAEWKERFS